MAKKHKADIKIHLDLTKCHYLSLKDAHSKAKNFASVDFTCADVNCLFCLRLNNEIFQSLEELIIGNSMIHCLSLFRVF